MTTMKLSKSAIILFISLLISSLNVSSQSNNTKVEKQGISPVTIEEKLHALQGTIQIQVRSMRYKPSIPYNIDEIVEKNRKNNDVVYIELGTDVRLKIFPKSHVADKKMELISTF
ncbi:MAG: hypothetical protein K0S53_2801 [Bacteroidetes bacterium]|jgi:hypothetical protein|nr:hypothetical protein [Bacteroidota bacterium]